MEVLRSATIYAAELVRKEKELGSVEPGKLADLLVLSGNPLERIENTRAIETVILDGNIVDTSFHPDYKNPIPSPGLLEQVMASSGKAQIDDIQPPACVQGPTADLEIELTGRFYPTSKVLFKDKEVATRFVSPRTVRVTIPASLLKDVGTYPIKAITPVFKGGTVSSNTASLFVQYR